MGTASQGMYKNRIEDDRKILEITSLLSCKRGNSAESGAVKFKLYVILNFPALDFLVSKIKEWEFQKKSVVLLKNTKTIPKIYSHAYVCCKKILANLNFAEVRKICGIRDVNAFPNSQCSKKSQKSAN